MPALVSGHDQYVLQVPFKLLSEAMCHIYVYTSLEVTRGRNAISIMKS